MQRRFSDRALIVSASILGVSLVLGAWIVSKNSFALFMSPFLAHSVQTQFVTQVKKELSHPLKAPNTNGRGKTISLSDVSVQSIAYEKLGDMKTIKIEYILKFKPVGSFHWSCYLNPSQGHYRGNASYTIDFDASDLEPSVPIDIQ